MDNSSKNNEEGGEEDKNGVFKFVLKKDGNMVIRRPSEIQNPKKNLLIIKKPKMLENLNSEMHLEISNKNEMHSETKNMNLSPKLETKEIIETQRVIETRRTTRVKEEIKKRPLSRRFLLAKKRREEEKKKEIEEKKERKRKLEEKKKKKNKRKIEKRKVKNRRKERILSSVSSESEEIEDEDNSDNSSQYSKRKQERNEKRAEALEKELQNIQLPITRHKFFKFLDLKNRKKLRSRKDPDISLENSCICKNSNCLILLCSCFKTKGYCLDTCRCKNCFNNEENEDLRQLTIKNILSVNKKAFLEKKELEIEIDGVKILKNGCGCRRNNCVDNNCYCRKDGNKCSSFCMCEQCENDKIFLSREIVEKYSNDL